MCGIFAVACGTVLARVAVGCTVRRVLLVARRAVLALDEKRGAHRLRAKRESGFRLFVSALSALCVNLHGDDAHHGARSGRVCACPRSSQGLLAARSHHWHARVAC